jgi:WD40 repeat protein
MNKKLTTLLALLIILAFIGYMIYDAATNRDNENSVVATGDTLPDDNWIVGNTYSAKGGELTSVAVFPRGEIVIGGGSFLSLISPELKEIWRLPTESKITSVTVSGDTVFASTTETILLVSSDGKLLTEWGPYESESIITSISADSRHVAFADAGNKRIYVLRKNGELFSMMGQSDEEFVIPSPYFDVALSDGKLFAANTGHRRVETWTMGGKKLSQFGEPGTAPEAFCGCCNPAHFSVIPQGFVTAEKGINRIKILRPDGSFSEFVSSRNDFIASVPLDVASADGKTIYAANSADNTVYVYKQK